MSSSGVINPRAFYNYLTAWATDDVLSYASSRAQLDPPPRAWAHDRRDVDLRVPKSAPIRYAQLPFWVARDATRAGDTEHTVAVIRAVREICDDFARRGLPNFPSGPPFTYWEQYVHLRSGSSPSLSPLHLYEIAF